MGRGGWFSDRLVCVGRAALYRVHDVGVAMDSRMSDQQPIQLTPPMFIDMTQQLLIQLHEVLRQEAQAGNVSDTCVKSVREVIINLRVLAPYVVRKLSERYGQQPPQHAQEATMTNASACVGTQT